MKNELSSLAVIIPAAGFGRRVGSPNAKELFLHAEQKLPLIEVAIQKAFQTGGRPVIVTRRDKLELVEYCEKHAQRSQIDLVLIENSREWPDSVLLSQGYWREDNILLLPDTDFSPIDILHEIKDSLIMVQSVWATHQVENGRTWGCLKIENQRLLQCEKPQQDLPAIAWGIIGFKKSIGVKIFESLLQSTSDHQWFSNEFSFETLPLNSFVDLTRSK